MDFKMTTINIKQHLSILPSLPPALHCLPVKKKSSAINMRYSILAFAAGVAAAPFASTGTTTLCPAGLSLTSSGATQQKTLEVFALTLGRESPSILINSCCLIKKSKTSGWFLNNRPHSSRDAHRDDNFTAAGISSFTAKPGKFNTRCCSNSFSSTLS